MTINLHLPSQMDTLRPKITVVGVGGAGGNAVNNMIAANLEGVEFVIANTDAQAIEMAQTGRVVQLGAMRTRGLGAGAKPEVGREAAEEAAEDIAQYIEGSHMVFITAGMGGGTGTGAAPVIARLAKEQGILTVGVVTKPFQFEGKHRMRIAESGIEELQSYVDTLIIIPNQNLFRIANERTTFAEAFRLADEVLHSGVRGVTDLIVKPGLVNLDFADIRAVMSEMGKAMMGTGEAGGERRAIDAAESAISNPLLDDVSLKGAKAVLINITGGPDMTLFEVDEAANRIRDEVDPDANIIFGSTFSDAMAGKMRVSVVATGIDQGEVMQRPLASSSRSEYVSAFTTPAPTAPVQQSQPVIKPFAYGTPKPAPTMQPAAGRTAAEIVRQSGSQSGNGAINDMVRAAQEKITPQVRSMPTQQSAPVSAAAPHKVLRIVDESVQVQDEAPLLKDAESDVFMSPRPERPAQSTLFTSQPVVHHEEDTRTLNASAEDAEEGEAAPSLFSRLGKALSGGAKESRVIREQQPSESAAPARKEVRVVSAAAGDAPEEDYDIPAFLRRQAN
jgi:cell division protein FtsZ